MHVRLRTAALPLALVALAACSDGTRVATRPAATPSPSASASAPATPVVDWNDPAATELAGGWSLGPCDGDAPLVCFSHGGEVQGHAEVVSFPAETISAVRQTLAAGGTTADALDAHADEFLASFGDDRTRGCGATGSRGLLAPAAPP